MRPPLDNHIAKPAPLLLAMKGIADFVLAAIGLVIAAPLMLIIAVLIKLESKGPVLFRQQRVGKNGHQFKIFKFRSMIEDAEALLRTDPNLREAYEKEFKLDDLDDKRITRSGRLLRRSKLDELPQLINVLLGQMSIVGPRPLVPDEVAKYYENENREMLLAVRPGITGYWQVQGEGTIQYPERVAVELFYINHYSPWLDVAISVRTAWQILRRCFGARHPASQKP